MHGLAALKLCCGKSYAERIDHFLDWAVPKLLDHQFTTSFVHKENSPEYHAFGLVRLKTMIRSGWFDRFNLDHIAKRVEQVDGWFLLPDGRRAPIGDSNGALEPAVQDCVFTASNQCWNDSGYAIFRNDGGGRVTDASYLMLMGGFNARAHKHEDDLSVIWFEGQDILSDAGKYAYKKCLERNYCKSRRAHNTVEVLLGSGQRATERDTSPYGSAITQCQHSAPFAIMTGRYKHSAIGYTHTRHVVYRRKSFLLLIDRIAAPSPLTIRLWSHFACHWDIQAASTEVCNDSSRYLLTSGRRRLLHMVTSDIKHDSQVYRAASKPLQGWRSTGYAKLSPCFSISSTIASGCVANFLSFYGLDVERVSLSLDAETHTATATVTDLHGVLREYTLSFDDDCFATEHVLRQC